MLRLAIIGEGKMGRRICELAPDFGLEPMLILNEHNNENGSGITEKAFQNVDVAIDFTHPEVVKKNIIRLMETKTPVVVGTTGWYDDSGWVESLIKKNDGRLVYGSNFSLGVQLFIKLARQAGDLFGKAGMFDATLHEVHHTEKADAPSGTAVTLAKQWLQGAESRNKPVFGVPERGKVDKNAFRITSQRTGSVFGEHSISINSPWDNIRISHEARSRDGFAAGALKTAKWIHEHDSSGFFLIEDIVEQVLRYDS